MIKDMTGRIGFHYYPDDRHYTQADLDTWLPRLRSLGANWLTLQSNAARAVPEPFIKGLLAAGIEPLIHLPLPIHTPSASFNPRKSKKLHAELRPLFEAYSSWGVRYVSVFDRPNLRSSWGAQDWNSKGLVERFLDVYLPVMHSQREAGLTAVFPALEPGGDYWDTAFLEAALRNMVHRGLQEICSDLILGVYSWTYEKPLDWGKGGPDRWIEARPYYTPPGSQNQLGLRIFDWYAAITEKVLGRSLKMLVLAGGSHPDHATQARNTRWQSEESLAIARALESGDLEPNILNFNYYLLAAESNAKHNHAAWYPTEVTPAPVVENFRKLVKHSAPKRASTHKPLGHYVLLSPTRDISSVYNTELLANLIKTIRPAIGFSVEEACLAREVTLVGGDDFDLQQAEQVLRTAGCTVHQFATEPVPAISSNWNNGRASNVTPAGDENV
jgi:hypothetical protein